MFCIFCDQVGVKKQALEQVASEFEVLEKDKQEIQQWISDVKKELSTTADQEDKNPDVVIRRRKLKVCLLREFSRVSHTWFSMLQRASNEQPEGNNWAQSVSATNNNNNKTTSLRFQLTEIFYFVGENN